METVVNNLEVTNNLDIEPEIQCRVLMTSTIESFSIGHTIVLSRGLIDVLPDEASLAAMLAKEMGYILTTRSQSTRDSPFTTALQFDEKKTFQHFDFERKPEEDAAASAKAAELLKNSPYKDQLGHRGNVHGRIAGARPRDSELDQPARGRRRVAQAFCSCETADAESARAISSRCLWAAASSWTRGTIPWRC